MNEELTPEISEDQDIPAPAPMRNYKNFWTRNAANLALTMLGVRTRRAPVMLLLDGDWICEFTGTPCDAYYSDFDTQQRARLQAGQAADAEIGLQIEPALDFGVVLDASIYGGKVMYSDIAPPTIEQAVESPEDIAELARRMDATEPLSLGLVPKMLEWHARLKAEYRTSAPAGLTVKGPGSVAGQICGITAFMTYLTTHPAEIKDLMALITRTTIRYIGALRRATGNKIRYLAMADDLSGMMSESMYREFVYPAHKAIFRALAPQPRMRYFHNDSHTEHILHHLRKLHLGGGNLDAKVTVLRIRERLPNTVIFGHIPPLETLRNGTPEDVRRTALANVAHARAGGGRIVLTAAGSINPGTPFENLRAVVQASRESARC